MEEDNDLALLQSASADSAWFHENYGTILKEHDNQYVAVKNRQLVAFAASFSSLVLKLKAKNIEPANARIKYIRSAPRILFRMECQLLN